MPRISEDRSVGVFWDFENISPPQSVDGAGLVDSIRRALNKYGPIKQFRAYRDADLNPNSLALRVELQASGVSIIDCPHNNQKDVADKMLIVDVMAFSREYPNATIVLIAGDRDYVYMISILRSYLHNVIVITNGPNYITSRASDHIEWRSLLPRTVWPLQNPTPFSSAPNIFYPGKAVREERTNYTMPKMYESRPSITQLTSSTSERTEIVTDCVVDNSRWSPIPSRSSAIDVCEVRYEAECIETAHDEPESSLPVVNGNLDVLGLACMIPLPQTPSVYSSRLIIEEDNDRGTNLPGNPPSRFEQQSYATAVSRVQAVPIQQQPSTQVVQPQTVKAPVANRIRTRELYRPLINVLMNFSKSSQARPLRGTVAEQLKKLKPNPYAKLKVTSWAAYAKLAEEAGVIKLGAFEPGKDWVTLTERYKTSEEFDPMVDFLVTCAREGKLKLSRSTVNDYLLKFFPGLYVRSGYSSWREYATAAEKAGLVSLTGGESSGGGGSNFIGLARKWRSQLL